MSMEISFLRIRIKKLEQQLRSVSGDEEKARELEKAGPSGERIKPQG